MFNRYLIGRAGDHLKTKWVIKMGQAGLLNWEVSLKYAPLSLKILKALGACSLRFVLFDISRNLQVYSTG